MHPASGLGVGFLRSVAQLSGDGKQPNDRGTTCHSQMDES
jgi:hypothetical protein